MRNGPAEPITRHCMNTRCRKCRARLRWYRRKAWQCRKTPSAVSPGKK